MSAGLGVAILGFSAAVAFADDAGSSSSSGSSSSASSSSASGSSSSASSAAAPSGSDATSSAETGTTSPATSSSGSPAASSSGASASADTAPKTSVQSSGGANDPDKKYVSVGVGAKDASDVADAGESTATTADDAPASDSAVAKTSESATHSDATTSATPVRTAAAASPTVSQEATTESLPAPASSAPTSAASSAAPVVSAAAAVTTASPAPTAPAAAPSYQQMVADRIEAWTTSSVGSIDALPIPQWLKSGLEGVLWTVRRSLFNVAPTVAPVQLTGQVDGPVTGRVGAVDPEGDPMVYRLVKAPTSGTVQLNSDGTYTYSPGRGFTGVDSFVVAAQDLGLHVNLLDLFGPRAATGGTVINQGAIKFAFTYTDGADLWTQDRRDALQRAANDLVPYFIVKAPVTLTYTVTGVDDVDAGFLARAGSDINWSESGFEGTAVQKKLLTGVDSNGADPDGSIDWNWSEKWGLGDTVAPDEYDFTSTVMHELLHSFGLIQYISGPGKNTTNEDWSTFDKFVVNQNGIPGIGPDLKWNSAFDPNLTGGNGGLYFGGPNAVAAYGGPVPLFTPSTFTGSSIGHLDDATFTGTNQKLMNSETGTGPGVRVLSAAEIGIFEDLGYTMAPQSSSAATIPAAVTEPAAAKTAAASATSVPPTTPAVPVPTYGQMVADRIEAWTSSTVGSIEALPVPQWLKSGLEGALWTVRRALFNVAPSVSPVQISGQVDGPVAGRVGAVDPEGDPLVYRLVAGPTSGTVQLNSDGTYTYSPGAGFTGVDSFVVAAQDLGWHVNLLDPFRPAATAAGSVVNQGAITFAFTYTDGADLWTPERRDALQQAANDLVPYFVVNAPVTLTYAVTGSDDPDSGVGATAGSNFLLSVVPDLRRTVVQHELITGTNPLGVAVAGNINWNWGNPWALGDTVGADQLDFTAAAMHELLHSFGFLSNTNAPGQNTGNVWSVFDGYIVDENGVKLIGSDLAWNAALEPNVTGVDGGLYFDGPNAVAAYGGLVPLYTPNPWSASSLTHLDDTSFTGASRQLMNANLAMGPGVRVLSAVELGIMQDLGYTVNRQASAYAAPMQQDRGYTILLRDAA